MQKEIHPQYYPQAKAVCVCGASFQVGSTSEKINVEICSACHPFYTGGEKIVDTAGRVERFKKMRSSVKTQPERSKKSARGAAPAGGQGSASGGKI